MSTSSQQPAPAASGDSPTTSATAPKDSSANTPLFPLTANDLTPYMTYTAHASGGLGLRALVSLPAGALLTRITTSTPTTRIRYSSVQVSRAAHVELNSGLLYMNHSCAPSLDLDVSRMEVRVAKDRDLREGDMLTFFYPSTEWDMDAPFECVCGAEGCVRRVAGAKGLGEEVLARYFLNEHVREMVQERERGVKAQAQAQASRI